MGPRRYPFAARMRRAPHVVRCTTGSYNNTERILSMADPGDSLLRQVEEELRREHYARLWHKYWIYLAGGGAAAVLSVLGYQWMRERERQLAEAAGKAYEEAQRQAAQMIEANKKNERAALFKKIAETSPEGYKALARLQAAGTYARAGRTAEAVALYQSLADDANADPLLRGFAKLQAASNRLTEAEWPEMEERLKDLLKDDNPWHAAARELRGIAALKAGKLEEARATFEQLLLDQHTPPDMSARVRTLITMVTAPATEKPAGDVQQ